MSQSLPRPPIPDLHCHILPGIDDGSRNPAMTLAMLEEMTKQGVKVAVATPHFYPSRDNLDCFLARREKAVSSLHGVYDGSRHPFLALGAEVAYFPGISGAEKLSSLCPKGTSLFLLEMPVGRWTESAVSEILSLKEDRGLFPVLAHIERYLPYQKKRLLPLLLENGIGIQASAEFFLNPKTQKKALKMLAEGKIGFLGSDCHNMGDRSPNLGPALSLIEEKGLAKCLTPFPLPPEAGIAP